DGEERGASPLSISVVGGAHDVVAERPRWQSAHARIDGPGHVQLTLSRPQARLRIVSTTPGALVRLDGREIGATPLELDADAYELHFIRVELDGHVWHRKIYLRPPGGSVHVGARAPSVDQTGAIRVAHDLGERVRP
ncbi:MAG TPA: PEGA domain-containing protein, partial [Polyangia bacterium]